MDYLEFERELAALKCGELRLRPAGENGLTEVASGWFGDMKRLVAALEDGYRTLCELVDAYRANDRRRETLRQCKGLQEARALAGEKWSRRAALGYAAMAANQLYGDPARVVQLLELMEDIMDAYTRRTAEGYYDALREDGETDSSTPLRSAQNDKAGDGSGIGTPLIRQPDGLTPSPEGEGFAEGGEC